MLLVATPQPTEGNTAMQDATVASRYLAILVRMTSFDLLFNVFPVVLSIARLTRHFRRGDCSPTRMFEFETALQDLLREMGRRIMEWTLNGLEPDQRCNMPPLLLWDGEYYRLRDKSPLRNLNSLFGPISLRRYLYEPLETGGKCLFPLQIQLGIVMGVATPALADWVARKAADLTQRQLLNQLRSLHVTWGVATLRKVTRAMAELMSEHRQEAQVRKLIAWLQQADKSKGSRRPTLSVGRDGIMIPIVKQSQYKEASTATVSVLDRRGHRLGTVYLAQMPESQQVTLSADLTALIWNVLAQLTGPLPRLAYVTDCGHHPTDYFETVLSKMPNPQRPKQLLQWEWIVDYYHACQYITKLGEAIFGPGRAAFSWAAKQRRVLKTKSGGIFRVLRSAGALRMTRGLVGAEDTYQSAYAYLRKRTSKMDYPTYRRFRLPIGSGVTEAACKIVFTQRFKQSGMKWKLEGGDDILRLRITALSGIWSEVRTAAFKSAQLPKVPTPAGYSYEIDEDCRKVAA